MRWVALGLGLGLAACAGSGIVGDDDASPPTRDGATTDALVLPIDASPDADASPEAYDAGCAQDGPLGGIGVPPGSVASATTTYDTDAPSLAIDGDEGTYWNAGGPSGSLTVTFPAPVTFDGVRLYVVAVPSTSETFTVYGIQDDVTIELAQSTANVQQGGFEVPVIAVPNAAYDGVRIDIDGGQSWAALAEITLVTTACP